jgi:uncharacterized membrane protein (UPF0127 family)
MRNDLSRLSARVFLMLFLFQGCSSVAERLCLRDACFSLEVMRTDEGRERGLMFRKGLDEGHGMLFVFDRPDIYPFWMKNMDFPIDILWLDKEKRVVHIETHVPPCRTGTCPVYTPVVQAIHVLEIPADDVRKHGIMVGDILH